MAYTVEPVAYVPHEKEKTPEEDFWGEEESRIILTEVLPV